MLRVRTNLKSEHGKHFHHMIKKVTETTAVALIYKKNEEKRQKIERNDTSVSFQGPKDWVPACQ